MSDESQIFVDLQQELTRWQMLLDMLSEEQITAVYPPANRSLKDDIAHLWKWQERSVARLEAAAENRIPDYGVWPSGLDPEAEDVDTLNAWIYESNRERPWPAVYSAWHSRYLQVINLGAAVPEAGLLSKVLYPWLDGYSLFDVLAGTLDHHREHYDYLAERPYF